MKLALLSEMYICNQLSSTILKDIELLQGYLDNNMLFCNSKKNKMEYLLNCLQNNKIPINWLLDGFLTPSNSIDEFIKILIIKVSHLDFVINKRRGVFFP